MLIKKTLAFVMNISPQYAFSTGCNENCMVMEAFVSKEFHDL